MDLLAGAWGDRWWRKLGHDRPVVNIVHDVDNVNGAFV
jgi:hypothetical protein